MRAAESPSASAVSVPPRLERWLEDLGATLQNSHEQSQDPLSVRSPLGPPAGAAEFEAEARLLLALKLYETGKLSTGVAAKLAGVPRVTFLFLLGQHGLSPFGEEPEELERDLANAQQARSPQ